MNNETPIPAWWPSADELKELSAYRPNLKPAFEPRPKRTPEECVEILLSAGFNHTQIKALNKVGAIRP